MRHIAQLIVMWLIAVTLPVQGAAATIMLHCGSTPVEQLVMPTQSTHVHHHAASAVDEGTELNAALLHAAHQHDDARHGHHSGKSSCSACASCCSATAPPTTTIGLTAQRVDERPIARIHLPIAAFLTGGPERPPRTLLA